MILNFELPYSQLVEGERFLMRTLDEEVDSAVKAHVNRYYADINAVHLHYQYFVSYDRKMIHIGGILAFKEARQCVSKGDVLYYPDATGSVWTLRIPIMKNLPTLLAPSAIPSMESMIHDVYYFEPYRVMFGDHPQHGYWQRC